MNKKKATFKSKIPSSFQPLIETALSLKLYLIQENGPSSFQFKDDNDVKLKVSISHYEIFCSLCKNNSHCEHTIYVMLKIFKLEKENPLICQPKYSDQEISDLIQARFAPPESKKKNENYLKKRMKNGVPLKSTRKNSKLHRIQISEGSVCPICQEEMNENVEALFFCKKQCGNNFHIKCLKIWVKHKESVNQNVTCPMCRFDWGSNVFGEICREEDLFLNKNITHKLECNCCNLKNIRGNIYHCLFCKDFFFCESCFLSWQHSQHNRIILKEKVDSEWIAAPDRRLENATVKKVFRNEEINEYIIESLPNLSQSQQLSNCNKFSFSNVDLQIVGCDILRNKGGGCALCDKEKGELKKLNCGHNMHKTCLEKNNYGFKCPFDGNYFFNGWPLTQNIPDKNKTDLTRHEKKIERNKKEDKENVLTEKKKQNNFRIKSNSNFSTVNNLEFGIQGTNFLTMKKF